MFTLGQLTVGWRDLLDIFLVAVLCYYGIRFVRGTRAMAALNGLLALLVLYAGAQFLGLFTLVWMTESTTPQPTVKNTNNENNLFAS